MTNHFGCVVFVTIGLHIPNDLVAEQLRYLRSLEDEASNVAWTLRKGMRTPEDSILTQFVIPQCLHDLRDKEESEVHRMLFQNAMSILQQQRVVAVALLEVCDSQDRRRWCP